LIVVRHGGKRSPSIVLIDGKKARPLYPFRPKQLAPFVIPSRYLQGDTLKV